MTILYIDLTGQTFERLAVINKADSRKNGQIMWNCKCICGDLKQVSGSSLKKRTTRSCGCLRDERLRDRKNHNRKNGKYKTKFSDTPGEAGLAQLFKVYQSNAAVRGYVFEITKE